MARYYQSAVRRVNAQFSLEKALGAKFDLRHFHDELLNEGGAPLSVLEKKLDRWVNAQKKNP